ncbi:MAG: preprotein translocase subunit SecE [Phycisphaerales bacterium]|nr:preprotein translocase subunit SecE [Phycisphaerales bacterium]
MAAQDADEGDLRGHGDVAMADDEASGSGRTGRKAMADHVERESGGAPAARQGRSFFELYKPSQGTYTRAGTAIGGAILVLGGANFLYQNLEGAIANPQWSLAVQVGLTLAVVVVFGLLLYWVVGVKRGPCDFFIATEGEMKKVSWTTRNELIGSTKVVIGATLILGTVLFLVDYLFIEFFQLIHVLHGTPS